MDMELRSVSGLIGGVGFTVSGAVEVVRISIASSAAAAALAVLGAVLWGVAVLALTLGLHRRESVVGRRRSALVASAVLAVWPTVDALMDLFGGPDTPAEARAGVAWNYVSPLVALGAGLVVSAHIARARVVPAPWNRMPLWVLGIQVAVWFIPQFVGTAAPTALIHTADLFVALGVLGVLVATFGLGFVSLLLSLGLPSSVDPASASPSGDS